ncbi:hypothetical protein BRC62_00675 [Halobacteriales archaeon QH_10_67_13]|nr:MAG: hypothetical protein BRC62_00675 [Halobacteriales archaeon QH_10_67_13]
MELARLTAAELEAFLDELWVPAQREMAALGVHTLQDDDTVRVEGKRHLRARIDDERSLVCVAREEGLLGYAAAELQMPPPIFEQRQACHVNELFVRESARRRGVGTRLLEAVEAWAADNDCDRLTLTVDADNRPARELYAAAGYGTTRETMTKPVDPAE